MRLLHYASQPVTKLVAVEQLDDVSDYAKPQGLWVSVEGEDDWPSWCRENSFGGDRLQILHEITLVEAANIHVIKDVDEFDAFDDRWSRDCFRYGMSFRPISWPAVAEAYDGLIIAPYLWSRRLGRELFRPVRHGLWYYGWDCASGCIWNPRAIERVTVLKDEREVAHGTV